MASPKITSAVYDQDGTYNFVTPDTFYSVNPYLNGWGSYWTRNPDYVVDPLQGTEAGSVPTGPAWVKGSDPDVIAALMESATSAKYQPYSLSGGGGFGGFMNSLSDSVSSAVSGATDFLSKIASNVVPNVIKAAPAIMGTMIGGPPGAAIGAGIGNIGKQMTKNDGGINWGETLGQSALAGGAAYAGSNLMDSLGIGATEAVAGSPMAPGAIESLAKDAIGTTGIESGSMLMDPDALSALSSSFDPGGLESFAGAGLSGSGDVVGDGAESLLSFDPGGFESAAGMNNSTVGGDNMDPLFNFDPSVSGVARGAMDTMKSNPIMTARMLTTLLDIPGNMKKKSAYEDFANELAAQRSRYLSDYESARQAGTWNDQNRASYMNGQYGAVDDWIQGMLRRAASNAAAMGRGGGAVGKEAEKIRREGRSTVAQALSKTYEPQFVAPANTMGYDTAIAQANMQKGAEPDWLTSALSGLTSSYVTGSLYDKILSGLI